VASTGVCHHVASDTTYRPRTSGGGHGDIGHGDDDLVRGASVNYFFALVLSSTGPDVEMHVPASPSPATQRNTLLQRVCGTRTNNSAPASHHGLRLVSSDYGRVSGDDDDGGDDVGGGGGGGNGRRRRAVI